MASKIKIVLLIILMLIAGVMPQAFAKNKTIVLATLQWAPFYGPDLEDEGYLTALTREAFKRAGYDYKTEYMPWNRALELSKKGTYDGALGIFYNEERAKFFEYSSPLEESRMTFFTRKDQTIQYKNLQDLSHYKIGQVLGYHYTEEFNNATYLNKYQSYSTEVNINLLLRKKIDIIIASEKVITYLLNNKFSDRKHLFKKIDPPLVSNLLHIAISKKITDAKQIISDFNRELKNMKKDGTFNQIKKKHGF